MPYSWRTRIRDTRIRNPWLLILQTVLQNPFGHTVPKLCPLVDTNNEKRHQSQRISTDKQKTFGMPSLFFRFWQLAYPDIPESDGIVMILEQKG